MKKKEVGIKNSKPKTIWFPAKTYGYGWGLPKVWQGWAVLLGLLVLGLAPIMYVSTSYKGDTYCQGVIDKGIETTCSPDVATGMYLLASVCWLVACVMLLYTVCEKKGEKARWRWGKSKKVDAKKS